MKIDVDGIEEKIIAGGSACIAKAAAVIVEAPVQSLVQRIRAIEDLGFRVFDIVDPCYYHMQLSQVDILLVAKRIIAEDVDFRPWDKSGGKIEWDQWQYGSQPANPTRRTPG